MEEFMKAIFWEGDIEQNFIGHQCSEIWRDRIYAPFVEGKNGDVCIDIGANLGLTSLYFSKYLNKCSKNFLSFWFSHYFFPLVARKPVQLRPLVRFTSLSMR